MVSKHKNRWLRRWLVVIVFWAVPVAIVAVSEIREEMAYNAVDLERALTTWNFTDAQRAAGAPARCHGKPDEAQAAGCPADVLAANAPRQQEARNEYSVRRSTLMAYLWHAFVGYWIVPALTLLLVGVLIGGVRRAPGGRPRSRARRTTADSVRRSRGCAAPGQHFSFVDSANCSASESVKMCICLGFYAAAARQATSEPATP